MVSERFTTFIIQCTTTCDINSISHLLMCLFLCVKLYTLTMSNSFSFSLTGLRYNVLFVNQKLSVLNTSIFPGLYNAFICQSDKNKRRNSAVLSLLLPVLVSSVFLAVGTPHLALYQSQELYRTPARAGRTLMWDKRIIDLDDKMYVAGYIFGVFSAGFYVFARIPQIIKNVSPSLSLSLSLSWSLSPLHLSLQIISYTYTYTVHALFSGGSICTHVHSVRPWQCHLWSGNSPLLSGWHLSPSKATLVGGQSGHTSI